MDTRDFYDKRIKEDSTTGSVQLMDEYAKHVIEINLCTGKPSEFHKLTIADLRETNQVINLMDMTEDQAWTKAMEDLQAYNEECNDHNRQIMEQVTTKVGNKALADLKKLLDFAAVTTKLEIVSKPDGENQNEICGVFTEVWVDQWSVGMEGDSFEGFIYGKFANMEWLKIPYSC